MWRPTGTWIYLHLKLFQTAIRDYNKLERIENNFTNVAPNMSSCRLYICIKIFQTVFRDNFIKKNTKRW